MLTQSKIARDRATAFRVGVARYLHQSGAMEKMAQIAERGGDDELTKVGFNPLLLAAIPAALSAGAGTTVGNMVGTAYGSATEPSAATVAEREYDLAAAETQRLIDELEAKQHNQAIRRALETQPRPRSGNGMSWL